ncbi:MAG: LysR family transcriptional regulator [Deltaproteobacteria bacterium]|nr:LysR family transcriptional regulator [Deltaproteobacteria bacterium]
MNFTLRQLSLFEAVARHQSFTRAAQELHLTQPAVSIQIKLLEESVGLPLFEKTGRKISLTRAGKEMFRTSLEFLDRLEQLEQKFVELRGGLQGNLNISVISAAKYFAPLLLAAFLRLYPGVNVRMQVTNREILIEGLKENRDDLIIMGLVPDGLAVQATPFLENLLVLAAPPGHPLAHERSIPVAHLAGEKWVLREEGSGTRMAMEQFFAQHHLPLHVSMELGSSEAVKHGVMAGLGLSVMSAHNIALELAEGYLVALNVEGFPLRRHWYAVMLEGRRLNPVAHTFLDFLREQGAQVVAQGVIGRSSPTRGKGRKDTKPPTNLPKN